MDCDGIPIWHVVNYSDLCSLKQPEHISLLKHHTNHPIFYVPEKTATRKVTSFGELGHCNCSACNWCVDPYDLYCRRCGARFTETIYERAKR